MHTSRTLGLVGGFGVGATVFYYQRLAALVGDSLRIVISHGLPGRVYEYVQAKNPDGLTEYLNGFLRSLKAAGAEVAAIPAVTPHYSLAGLRAASPLPILSIFDPLVAELTRRNVKRVAIFGTRFVVESGLYGQLGEVEVISPRAEELELIHSTYVEVAATGRGTEGQHAALTGLAKTLIERDGAEAILFAGTDLSAVFHEGNTAFPHLDCAELHVRAIARELGGAKR